LLGIGRGGQHGVVAVRMEAKHNLAAWTRDTSKQPQPTKGDILS